MPLIAVTIRANDRKVAVQVDTVKTVAEFKEAIQASELNIPQDRQKLIYSGRVLKDDETVEKYGIQNGQTVHLVQTQQPPGTAGQGASGPSGSSRPSTGISIPPSSSTGPLTLGQPQPQQHSSQPPQQQQQQPPPPQQQIPTNLASGTGAFNPFAGLTGARYAGQMALPNASMFGPDPGNQAPMSPEQMTEMMGQPGVQQAMNQVLSDPRMIDYLIQSQPQLQSMGPGIREVMQSEEFRRTMTNPQTFRNMLDMNRMFSQMGMQVPGMPAQRNQSFPAPGVTNTTPPHQQQPTHQQGMAGRPGQQTGAGGLGPQSPPQMGGANPFDASFFPHLAGGQQPGQQGGNGATNPFIALFPPTSYQGQFGAGPQSTAQGLAGQQPPLAAQQTSHFGAQQPLPQQQRSGTPTFQPQGQPLQQQPSQQQQQQAMQPSSQPTSPPPQQSQQQLPFGTQPAPGQSQMVVPDAQQMQQMLQALQSLQNIFGQPQPTNSPVPGQAASVAAPTGFGQPAPGAYVPPLNNVPAVNTYPLEERYQDQLRQLNDMGFTDYARNIAALRRTGGNVNAAIEMLLSGAV